jgi:hypothetical protein
VVLFFIQVNERQLLSLILKLIKFFNLNDTDFSSKWMFYWKILLLIIINLLDGISYRNIKINYFGISPITTPNTVKITTSSLLINLDLLAELRRFWGQKIDNF